MPKAERTAKSKTTPAAETHEGAASVHLFIGEPFLTEAAARALIDEHVPPERRSFNLEIYDGRTAAIGPVLDSLRMPGLFSGTKVIWVREPALFVSGEKRADLSNSLFAAWTQDRRTEAAEKLLLLAALAGWSQEQFSSAQWGSLSGTEVSGFFGRTLEEAEREALTALHAHCREHGLEVSAFRDESGLLEDFLQRGMPAGNVLLFTATAVDRRKRVVKAIGKIGRVEEMAVARERSGALAEESVDQLVDRILSRHGKRLAPAARRVIGKRAGGDAAQLASEVEKLCLYVGDRANISEDDARASVLDLAESWVFDFTRALARRNGIEAISMLRGLFGQGEHPLRLLALIARELRLLLLARDCLTGSLRGAWNQRMPFYTFRDRLLPKLDENEREAFGGVHPYAIYQALQNASEVRTAALQRAVLKLQQLDVKLKSSGGDPRLLLEAFVLEMCRAG